MGEITGLFAWPNGFVFKLEGQGIIEVLCRPLQTHPVFPEDQFPLDGATMIRDLNKAGWDWIFTLQNVHDGPLSTYYAYPTCSKQYTLVNSQKDSLKRALDALQLEAEDAIRLGEEGHSLVDILTHTNDDSWVDNLYSLVDDLSSSSLNNALISIRDDIYNSPNDFLQHFNKNKLSLLHTKTWIFLLSACALILIYKIPLQRPMLERQIERPFLLPIILSLVHYIYEIQESGEVDHNLVLLHFFPYMLNYIIAVQLAKMGALNCLNYFCLFLLLCMQQQHATDESPLICIIMMMFSTMVFVMSRTIRKCIFGVPKDMKKSAIEVLDNLRKMYTGPQITDEIRDKIANMNHSTDTSNKLEDKVDPITHQIPTLPITTHEHISGRRNKGEVNQHSLPIDLETTIKLIDSGAEMYSKMRKTLPERYPPLDKFATQTWRIDQETLDLVFGLAPSKEDAGETKAEEESASVDSGGKKESLGSVATNGLFVQNAANPPMQPQLRIGP